MPLQNRVALMKKSRKTDAASWAPPEGLGNFFSAWRRASAPFTLFIVCVLMLCPRISLGDVIISAFQVDHEIQFTRPDFSDARWSATLTFSVAASSAGTTDFPLKFWPGNYGLSFDSSGGVTLDQASLPAGTASDILHVAANGAGLFQVHETAGPGTLDSGDPLAVFTSTLTGRQDLLFEAPASSRTVNLPVGIPWTTNIRINGDWSQASDGNVQGTHKLLYLDPFWSIQSDFVYDPSMNETLLSVYNPSYLERGATSQDDGPYPAFGLVGPVPEPSDFGVTAAGLLAILLAVRRRTGANTERNGI